jgi:hypothetical protein
MAYVLIVLGIIISLFLTAMVCACAKISGDCDDRDDISLIAKKATSLMENNRKG